MADARDEFPFAGKAEEYCDQLTETADTGSQTPEEVLAKAQVATALFLGCLVELVGDIRDSLSNLEGLALYKEAQS